MTKRRTMPMPEGDHLTMGEYQTLGGAESARLNLNAGCDGARGVDNAPLGPRMMGEDTLSEAHELARLRAENAALRADINEALQNALHDGIVGMERERIERLTDERDALRAQIANAIRLYPQLAERITSSAPDPSFGNPRRP